MNPFDLPGLQFLFVYFVFGSLVIVALYFWRIATERGKPPKLDFSDPYLIAYLRGGQKEAMRVGMVSLIDRGLLTVDGKSVLRKQAVDIDRGQLPVEKAVLAHFSTFGNAKYIATDAYLKAASRTYETTLRALKLLPDAETKARREKHLAFALVLIVGTALIKVALALYRGHTNVWFLIGLAILFCGVICATATPFRTRLGDRVLADLQNLFSSRHRRAGELAQSGTTQQTTLLAAVFGAALPAVVWPYITELYANVVGATTAPTESSAGSCGAACSASCGGACGGCGGCGGCA